MTRLSVLSLVLAIVFHLVPASAQSQPTTTGNLVVSFLDVGQGDSILIRSPEGKTALIDAGPSHEVVSLLKSRGVRSLDLVVVTHHHADHYGGMEAVIREFQPRLFLATNSSHTTPTYLKLLKLVRDRGIQAVSPANDTRTIRLGSVVLWVFPQPPENHEDENDNSIGLRVQYGNFSALLTGDSEARERAFWEQQVPQFVRDCTILKLAHHGSRNGTDARWLSLIRPQLAVASLGRDNEFGHPHPETLALLTRYQIPLLRTDVDGTVTVVSNGKTWDVSRRSQVVRGPPVNDEKVARAKDKHGVGTTNLDRPINVNTASQKELESLPGIGSGIAQRIIEGRPYRTVNDLRRIKGIGEKRFEEIRRLVRVH